MRDRRNGEPRQTASLETLYDAEIPGGWAAHRRRCEEQCRRERELEARSPWRRLERRIERMAHEAGIEPELARKIVKDRLASEIAESIVTVFRSEVGLQPAISHCPQGDVPAPEGKAEGPRVATPYMGLEEAARYLRKTPKAIYGLIERGRLKKMPGSRTCLFTREMLDDFLKGETTHGRSLHAGRRKKG